MIKNYEIRSAGEYKNRRIGNYLKELGLTEGRNTGIPLTIEQLKKNGSDLPLFITDVERQSLIVRIPVNSHFLKNTDGHLRLYPGKHRNSTELEKDILALLATGDYSANMISSKLGFSGVSKNLKNTLNILVEKKLITISGSHKSTRYSLAR